MSRIGGPVTTPSGVAAGSPRMSAEERRQQLIGIGLDLLETRPIHELALDEVAAVAGVSRTLVFHYFPSKGDFYAAVVGTAGRRLMQASPHVPDADVPTRLRAMVTSFLKFVARKRGTYVALVRGAPGVDPQVLAELDGVRVALVELWLDAAEWPHRDEITALAVRGWLGALEEVALVTAAGTDVPRQSVVELLVQGLLDDLELARRVTQQTVEAHSSAAPQGR